jgi:hypothetical protein
MFLLPKNYWTVKKTPHKGRGVFATKDIAPGMVIGDYIGKMINSDEDDKYLETIGFYLMYYSEYTTIIPDLNKKGIHLINHSCTPNLGMFTYKGHTLFFSLRKIFKGEELLISYQMAPLDNDCNPCEDLCYCGAFNCRKTMHLPEKKYNKWYNFDTRITKKTKRPRAKIGETLPVLADYPEEIKDYPVYDLFGSEKKRSIHFTDKTLPPVSLLRALIRQTGRYLQFDKLGIRVLGVADNKLVTKNLNS